MKRVYTASKLETAATWRELQQLWARDAFFHARWLRHTLIGTPDSPEHAARFWFEDEEDVKYADALIVYATPEQHLRGALVEVGIAIASKVPVIVVGAHADYGTWQYHDGVIRVDDFDGALAQIKALP